MKNQKGFTLVELIIVLLFFVVIPAWVFNIVKLSDCDFAAPYRCEIIHAIGVIPVAAPVTVWFADDSEVAK